MTRGEFLDTMLKGVAALGLLGGIGAVLSYLSPPQERMLGGGEPLEVAEEADIPLNTGRVVAYGSAKLVLIHTEAGFAALSAVCTHAGCLVNWDAESKRIHCPCHDGFFDLNGNVISGPPPKPLKVFRAEVQGGKVMVSSA
jgi:cytochrome b6-f complex iron-sulfur subunit